MLEKSIIAVQTEISLPEIYEGQADLGDVVAFLRQYGMKPTSFLPHGVRGHGFQLNGAATRTPIGLRGGGAFMQADMLFFKEPQYIVDNHEDAVRDLVKAIFIGIIHNYFDYCYACGTALLHIDRFSEIEFGSFKYKYADFVKEYLEQIKLYPELYPVKWTSVFQPGSQLRYDSDTIKKKILF